MTRMSRLLGTAAIMLMSGIAVSYAQYGTGRALLAYPMKGQTLEQENADRSACHDWAVAQTGYDPTLVYAAQQYWIKPGAGTGASMNIRATRTSREVSWEPWETPRDAV